MRKPRPRMVLLSAACLLGSAVSIAQVPPQVRPCARQLGIAPGIYPTGNLNAITDVAGVQVGHTTVIEGDDVRTGVTAVVPHGGNLFQEKVAGAVFVGNAFGKLAGSTQVMELGTIETPIVLTNTLSVGVAVDAVVRYTLAQSGNEQVRSVNAVVGETNDGNLNDIRGLHVSRQHVLDAITHATSGPVPEGSVGAGTGTINFGWKGGIGTSSRVVPGSYVIGVLAQTNYGGNLTIAGVPIFRLLSPPPLRAALDDPATRAGASAGDGLCMLVVATDAPLDARDLSRFAARAVFGLGRTGSSFSNGSGDYAVAFSTSPAMRSRFGETELRTRQMLPTDAVSPLFQAALEATEEAVYNALFQATTVRSKFGTAQAIPIDRVRELLPK
ncbi:MAG TPA: P1 family peptidase [Vicinamibacterales bacterium]|nr:P1 family peptidase [Vicinamibacterales bacterium]